MRNFPSCSWCDGEKCCCQQSSYLTSFFLHKEWRSFLWNSLTFQRIFREWLSQKCGHSFRHNQETRPPDTYFSQIHSIRFRFPFCLIFFYIITKVYIYTSKMICLSVCPLVSWQMVMKVFMRNQHLLWIIFTDKKIGKLKEKNRDCEPTAGGLAPQCQLLVNEFKKALIGNRDWKCSIASLSRS